MSKISIIPDNGAKNLMTKFEKCTKPFSSNKIESKIVFTWIIVSTRQLAKHIKTVNKKEIKCGEFANLI